MKTLAVMTSGGDAPGMNSAIRAVVRCGIAKGFRVIGFQRGYEGILNGQFVEMDARFVSQILQRGGTILKTARSKDFLTKKGQQQAASVLEKLSVYGLVLIGGDGTFRGALDLAKFWRGKIIGIPGTIDNDLYGTDFTLGYDTAVNTAVEAIDKIRDTADAHDRFFLVEVMGRHSGHLAMQVGLASGAEEILVPELPINVKAICERLCARRHAGKTGSIIVVAEGAAPGGAYEIAEKLKKLSRNEYRACILGHIQRGGSPTPSDRLLGARLGVYAVEAIAEGQTGKMAGEINGLPTLTPLRDAVRKKKPIPPMAAKLIRYLNI